MNNKSVFNLAKTCVIGSGWRKNIFDVFVALKISLQTEMVTTWKRFWEVVAKISFYFIRF